MTNQALTILQNAVAPSLLKQEANGLSPQIKNLSDRVQKAAGECLREYQQLCRHFSNGARDPELMEILFFSQKESKLLSQMSSEEKALYNRICETSIAAICPDPHHRAVQSSQQTAILKSFPTIVPVPGDGNCGLHAFTYGFVDQMNADDADKLKAEILKLRDKVYQQGKELQLYKDAPINNTNNITQNNQNITKSIPFKGKGTTLGGE